VPESEFEAACDLLSDPKSACYLPGAGSPMPSPPTWLRTCRIIRPNVRHFGGQTSTWRDQLLDVRPGDVAVLFDIRRYQSDLVRLGELLVERKARIMLITDPWLSPIARSARVVLPCVVDADRTWDSSITLLALAEALIDRVSRPVGTARARMQALEDIHWNKRQAADVFIHACAGNLRRSGGQRVQACANRRYPIPMNMNQQQTHWTPFQPSARKHGSPCSGCSYPPVPKACLGRDRRKPGRPPEHHVDQSRHPAQGRAGAASSVMAATSAIMPITQASAACSAFCSRIAAAATRTSAAR
jgi:hypothetical protein